LSLFKSIATVGGYTMLSRVVGFVRDMLHTAILGASPVSDAFIVAFKVPNFFRRMFAEGAFSSAFVPLFSSTLASSGKEEALKFAENVLAILTLSLLALVILAEIFMPYLMEVLAPGFTDEPFRFSMVVDFARITFPYLLFISLASLYSGILNTMGHFALTAFTPVLLNICMITALIGFEGHGRSKGMVLSISILIAGVVQLVWLMLALKRLGLRLHFFRIKLTPLVTAQLKRMLPVILSGGIFQLNMMIDVVLASFLAEGAVSYLYFADRIAQLPLGVVGVAVGTALLPLLSKQIQLGEHDQANHSFNRSLEIALFLSFPAAIALLIIPYTVIDTLFGHGAFNKIAVQHTSEALMAFSLGIPATVLSKVLVNPFLARGDTKNPFRIAVGSVALNLILNLILITYLQHIALALSTSIAAWVQNIWFYHILKKRGWIQVDDLFKFRVKRIFIASLAMTSFLVSFAYFLRFFDHGSLQKLLTLSFLVCGGCFVYFWAAHLTKAFTFQDLKSKFKKTKKEPL
jgi:putative peptidoglycan lipid II flippase